MSVFVYRAVTQWEYDDIISQNYQFRPSVKHSSLEAKLFTYDLDCGHYYGRAIVQQFDNVDYILLKVNVPNNNYFEPARQMDDCDAVSVNYDDLDAFNKSIIEISKIN